MVMMGAPGGGPFAGPSATQSSASAGLPFAGVPSEMQEGASEILKREPIHPEPVVSFHRLAHRASRLNLRSLFENHRIAALWGLFLLAVETITALLGPVLTQQGIDNGVMREDRTSLYRAVILFGVIIVINAITSFLRQRWNGTLGENIMYDVRLELFSHFQRMGLDWYTSEKSGVLLSRMTSDVEALTLLVNEGFVNLVIQALTVSIVTAVLFSYNPLLAILLLVLVLPPLVVMTLWFRTVSERGYSDVRDRIASVLADLSENLAGVRVIAALNRRRQNAESHRSVVGAYLDANLYTARAGAIYGPATEGIGIAAQAIVLLVGGWMVVDGSLQVGELTAFVLFVNTFFAPIQQMVQLYNTYQQGQSGRTKIGDILATRLQVRGVAGLVSDANVRDADGVLASGLPVWCPGAAAPASIANLSDGELNVPIGCGGVAVIPGDWIIADNDGVVVVPKNFAEEIARDGLEQEIHEEFILTQVKNGAPIPGHYPPNEVNISKYREWRGKTRSS